MILTGRDIQWYIEQGKLKIEPVTPEQFQQNGVDLILEATNWRLNHFEPMKFTLGTTREWIEMPDDLMAFVALRSTWARRGVMIPHTVVDAGFKGNITLEILPCAYITIPLGERFAHLIFARLSGPTTPYSGKYQGQRGITEAISD